MTKLSVQLHSGEVTFLDGTIRIVSVWSEKGVFITRHPKLHKNVKLVFVEEYENLRCYDEVEDKKEDSKLFSLR